MIKSSDKDIFPFAKNPELSWRQFEKNFRETYKDLDIPPFVLVDKTIDFHGGSTAAYIQNDEKLEECYRDNPDLFRKIKDACNPPVIVLEEKQIITSDSTAYDLLHELGHHYYDNSTRNRAGIISEAANCGAVLVLTAANVALLYRNGKNLFHGSFDGKKWLLQGGLLSLLIFKNEQFGIGSLMSNFIEVRPEEYAADAFANQHGTKAMLQAADYDYSLQGCVDNYIRAYCYEELQALSADEQKIARLAIEKHCSSYLSKSNMFDFAGHPSRVKRQKLVQKALKDRFGKVNEL